MSTHLSQMQSIWRNDLIAPAAEPAACQQWTGGIRSAGDGFAVYINNIRANLLNALAMTYPATERLAGAAGFRRAILSGLRNSPPATGNLADYGECVISEIPATVSEDRRAIVREVARYEWAIDQLSHLAQESAWSLQDAAGLTPAHWSTLTLRPVRQARLFTSDIPVRGWIRHALHDANIPEPGVERLLLVAGDNEVKALGLDATAWAWVQAIDASASLADATLAALAGHTGFDPQALLLRLIAAGAVAHPVTRTQPNIVSSCSGAST